jgi:hypothetical protein
MRVAVQPCGNAASQQHYVDTIRNLVPADLIMSHLTGPELIEFQSNFSTAAAVWGVTEGGRSVNRNKWSKLRPGDIALLYRDRRLFSRGRIAMCTHNSALARQLWGVDAEGRPWEYIYFLDDLQEIDIPVERFNRVMDYEPNNVVQGFNVYEGQDAEKLLGLLGVRPDDLKPEETPDALDDLQAQLAGLAALDVLSAQNARKESAIFRKHLFGKHQNASCHICGRILPVGLLVAAHIKPRASCTDAEKRDLRVVMSACKLGCDELYERGFVQVGLDGEIVTSEHIRTMTPDLKSFASVLSQKACAAHNEHTESYFRWHREHPRRVL